MEEDEPPPGLEPAHDADLRAAQELAAVWAAEDYALSVRRSSSDDDPEDEWIHAIFGT